MSDLKSVDGVRKWFHRHF